MLLWQASTISLHIIVMLMSVYYKYFRSLYLLFILIVSGASIYFVSLLNSLFFLKAFLIIIFAISLVGFCFSVRYLKFYRFKKKRAVFFIILFLSSLSLTSIGFLSISRRSVIISPKTSPELIFWTDPYFLPNDQEIYEICKKYNIGFMPAIGARTLNKSSLMERYKLAIANEINLYFSLVTPPDSFINMDNTDEYLPLYEDFKQWFIAEGIFNSSFVKSFVVDAEPPSRYTNEVRDESLVDSINYFIEEFPTKKEIEDATEDLDNLINKIKSDGKEAGIIRISPYMDGLDDDGEIELFLRNIYSLDVVWDYTITMVYRTSRIITESEDTAEVVIDRMKKNVFGQVTEDVNILSVYNFYFRVGMCEKESGDIEADDQYIFIGTLKHIFNDTDYMKNKEYLDDLDICRHFNKEKVFLFNYKNFIDNYGLNELINLGEHNQKDKSWELVYIGAEVQANIIFYLALAFIDRFLFLES